MFASLFLLLVITMLLAATLGVTVDTSVTTSQRSDSYEGRRTVRSLTQMTAHHIWGTYEATLTGGREPRLLDLRLHLETLGLTNQTSATPERVEMVDDLGLFRDEDGQRRLGDSPVSSILVHREDQGRNTLLHITATAVGVQNGKPIRENATSVFNLGAPIWEGLEFGLLANNVNCIMCHTTVDDVRSVYENTDASSVGGPIRARMGAIESFQIRHDPASKIGGTMYLGSGAIDDQGDPITDWSQFTLEALTLDDQGSIELDLYGNPTVVPLTPTSESEPEPFANLYTNYLDQEEPVDGELPDSFPLPFVDDGGFDLTTGEQDLAGEGNRIIDDLEFATTVATFSGRLNGGKIAVVEHGETVNSVSEARGLLTGNATELEAVTSGNVVLTGTEADPIRLQGKLAIDGDLVISGVVEGLGSLWVRGNVYVRGDLEYNDAVVGGSRAFGTGASGQPNALGLTAGGNIIMGDMYREAWGGGGDADGTRSGAWNFTLEQTAIFNRGEWLKTQPELPGRPVEVQVGTETRQRELFETVSNTYEQNITEYQNTGTTREEPVYENQQTGTRQVPVYESQQTGTREVPVYESQQTGTRQEPIYENVTIMPGTPYERTERQQTGTRSVPVYSNVQTGTRTEPVYSNVQTGTRTEAIYENVQVGTRTVEVWDHVVVGTETVTEVQTQPYSPRRYESYEVPIMEWQTPMFPNPDFRGADFVPRYYAFGEGDPVIVPTEDGYFDPAKGRWVAPEMVSEWDAPGLTFADPGDPNDPTLRPAGGVDAVIKTLEPSADWISAGALSQIIRDQLGARNSNDSFKVDATLYSANSIFGVIPNDPSRGTNGTFRLQGALLAADVGLLGPNGAEINYDPRGREVLQILDESNLGLSMVATLPAQKIAAD